MSKLRYLLIISLALFMAITPIDSSYSETYPIDSPWNKDNYKDPPPLPVQAIDDIIINEKDSKLSALERIYADRLIDELEQFGYDLFSGETKDFKPMGAVQDDFILGAGDELQITFTGQRTDRDTYKIDSSGMIIIKEFPPISAMGQTILHLREVINTHLASLHNTKAYVSLSSVRQINVLIIGNVKSPGRKNLNIFHNIIDALTLAGGVQKNGSLRQIKLIRNGKSKVIDLYNLLIDDNPNFDIKLRDGDRIIVPPIGATIAISGAVKRPAIYEIKYNQKLNLNALLNLASGVLSAGKNRFTKLELISNGQETIKNITNNTARIFGDSTILNVSRGAEKRIGTIELKGHARTTGLYDLSQNKNLTSLLNNDTILGDDIYPLLGVIERQDKEQITTKFLSFPVRLVLKNEYDLKMQSNDVVWLFSNNDMSNIGDDNNYKNNIKEPLKSFIKERSAFVRGAVRMAGSYPVSKGITLENILAVAGGTTLEANTENIEITSKNSIYEHQDYKNNINQRTVIDLSKTNPNNIIISAGDAIRVNQKFRKMDERTVLIIGEVMHPGTYDLLAGDKVSNLIKRAGGLTDQAYPAGSIFSRESERKAEELRFRKSAQNMQSSLAAAIQSNKDPPNAKQIEMVTMLANELTNIEAVGRITVETDPAILLVRKELDMLLEKGDRIHIPKRPLTVRVSGEILSPSNLQFRKDKNAIDYIHGAGGFTYHADKNRTFVLYPDGSAQPLRVSNWSHNPIFIPPGSTIIVPRDPKPFNFIETTKEIGQILSNLAITSVFINNISN